MALLLRPVPKELLYGYYLPMHCSGTDIANVDVVQNMFEEKPVTIAFLGDSVTQGCFECYFTDAKRTHRDS